MRRFLIPALILGLSSAARADFGATFEDLGVPANSFLNNAGASGQFVSGVASLNNSFDPNFNVWSGWAISSKTDTTTPGFGNQYSAITGGGSRGSATYAVGFTYGDTAFANTDPSAASNRFHPSDTYIQLAAGVTPVSIDITNTTYSYLDMRDGDPDFVTTPFATGDYQYLDIRGYDSGGHLVGTVVFSLADYKSTTATPILVKDWFQVDLTPLTGASLLQFGITSSRNDATFGVKTPAYFAADNLQVASVPEPASLALLVCGGIGIAGMVSFRKRRRCTDSLEGGGS